MTQNRDEKNTKSSVNLHIDRRGVATVTLNRPEKHNALNSAMIQELLDTLSLLRESNSLRVVVLAAEGKNFSAGADLNWMKNAANYNFEENKKDAKTLAILMENLDTLSTPCIAKVRGGVYGGALGLICCCDIVIASHASTYALSEAKLGLIPAVISPYIVGAIGERNARRYFVSAELIDSQKAQQIGLASELVDDNELNHKVEKCIESLLINGPIAMAESKKLLKYLRGKTVDGELIDCTSEWIANIRVSEEGQEGLQAFLEKRVPSWHPSSLKKDTTPENE